MRQCRAAGLLVAVSRAQVQQEPLAETTEGAAVNITCSHPNIQIGYSIYWYRQLPGRGPAFLVSAVKGSKEVPDPKGQLWVSTDRRSSVLRLARPRLGDAALYYCAVGARKRSRGCGRARTAWGGAGAQCRPGPQGALPAWPPNSILTGVRRPELSSKATVAASRCHQCQSDTAVFEGSTYESRRSLVPQRLQDAMFVWPSAQFYL
ncbi:immunoglobulin iota chain-like [Lagopus muta]|uniref:immunoglobulin iota chain-like n=1 Tax=Lagopus muta TaxID=64668 RepID=UPI00209F6A8C|nr:immunoglobulin iota chain-like [Lagopus muta]